MPGTDESHTTPTLLALDNKVDGQRIEIANHGTLPSFLQAVRV